MNPVILHSVRPLALEASKRSSAIVWPRNEQGGNACHESLSMALYHCLSCGKQKVREIASTLGINLEAARSVVEASCPVYGTDLGCENCDMAFRIITPGDVGDLFTIEFMTEKTGTELSDCIAGSVQTDESGARQ